MDIGTQMLHLKKNPVLQFLVMMGFFFFISQYFNIARIDFPLSAIYLACILAMSIYSMTLEYNRDNQASAYILIITLTILYFLLRVHLADFSLDVGDASSYTWDGVENYLTNRDPGFFPPLASAVSAVGYHFFGLSGTPIVFVVLSFVTLPILFQIFNRCGIGSDLAFVAVLFYCITPLYIWFSKTTFSECIWQVIVLVSISSLIFYNRSESKFLCLASTCFILVALISPMARGTAIFLMPAIIISVLFSEKVELNRRLLFAGVVFLIFCASFYVSLRIRSEYLIGWQFSKIVPGADVFPLFFSILIAGIIGIFLISFILKKYENDYRKYLRFFLLLNLLAVKMIFAYIMWEKTNRSFFDIAVFAELKFIQSSFTSAGLIVVVLGLSITAIKGIRYGGIPLYLLVFYFLFSLPLTLQSSGVYMGHEMLLYWHRYYFSEIFIIHFCFVVFAACAMIDISAKYVIWLKGPTFWRTGVFATIMLASISFEYFDLTFSDGYLSGSGKIFDWIKSISSGRRVYLFLDDNQQYGPYDAPFLFRNIRRYGVDVQALKVHTPDAKIPYDSIVICAYKYGCLEKLNGEWLGRYSGAINWKKHAFEAKDVVASQLKFNLEAIYVTPKLEVNSEFKISGFTKSIFKNEILGNGWYGIESHHVWSSAAAEIYVPIPQECNLIETCKITLTLFALPSKDNRLASIRIVTRDERDNDMLVVQSEVSKVPEKIEIPVARGVDRQKILLSIPGAVSPRTLGINSDDRIIGVGLKAIEISNEVGGS